MAIKIAARDVKNLQPNSILWDSDVRGLCVRRQFSETITWSVVYRNRDHQQKWFKVGRYPILTPTLARLAAIKILRKVTLGDDPSAERHDERNAMSFSQLCDDYSKDMQSGKVNGKKESTIRSDLSRIELHIKPILGKLKVVNITSDQITEFMNALSPGSAKRIIGLTGAIFSWAVKRKIRKDNPVIGLEMPPDVHKLRRLSNGEYQQIWKAINTGATHETASDIFLLLVLTGWRSGEAKNLKFSELDLERKVAILADTKTGVSVRPLSSAAIEVIKRQKANGVYVFEHHGKPVGNMNPHWRKFAMPLDVTPHTLRHSFASLAADLGLADHTIAGLLGHSRSSITSRYMHLADKALIEAADLVAAETLRLMQA
jgi:integrase